MLRPGTMGEGAANVSGPPNGAGIYVVGGLPSGTKSAPNFSLPPGRGALIAHRFLGEPARGPPRVAGGAACSIGGHRIKSWTYNDMDMQPL